MHKPSHTSLLHDITQHINFNCSTTCPVVARLILYLRVAIAYMIFVQQYSAMVTLAFHTTTEQYTNELLFHKHLYVNNHFEMKPKYTHFNKTQITTIKTTNAYDWLDKQQPCWLSQYIHISFSINNLWNILINNLYRQFINANCKVISHQLVEYLNWIHSTNAIVSNRSDVYGTTLVPT